MSGLINTILATLSTLLAPALEPPSLSAFTHSELVEEWLCEEWPCPLPFDRLRMTEEQSFFDTSIGKMDEKDDPTLCCPY